jgi:hypothetical protein
MGAYTCHLKKLPLLLQPNKLLKLWSSGTWRSTTGQYNFGVDTSSTSALRSQQYIPTVHSTQPVYMVSKPENLNMNIHYQQNLKHYSLNTELRIY